MNDISIKVNTIRIRHDLRRRMDGGPGSGNWGHAGRPGERGGSAEGGGAHNRQTNTKGSYTSFTQRRRAAIIPHSITREDMDASKADRNVIFVDKEGNRWRYAFDNRVVAVGDFGKTKEVSELSECKVILPNEANPNYQISREDRAAMSAGKEMYDKAFNPDEREDAYNKYVEDSKEVWNNCSDAEKDHLCDYTGSGYTSVNGATREGKTDNSIVNSKVDNITNAIDRNELSQDSVFTRGLHKSAAEKMFGLPEGYLSNPYAGREDNVSMNGRIGTDDGFMSAGSSASTGFNDKGCILHILAPKGTKALYVEPFSECGGGAGRSWDGESGQPYISRENETIIQRGTTVQAMRTEWKDGRIHIYCSIVRQNHESSAYSKKRKGE